MKSEPGLPMTLGSDAAAQVRLIVRCKACQHLHFGLLRGRSSAQNCWISGYLGFPMVIVRGLKAHGTTTKENEPN